jgi:hypothetical protein
MTYGSSDTTGLGASGRRWIAAVVATGLIAFGLVWMLSNIGPRGPRLIALFEERGRGIGIHVLDPLGLIPLAAGEWILLRARITSGVRAVVGTLLMAAGVVWLTRSAVPQGPQIWTVSTERGLHGADVVGIVCVAAALAVLLLPRRARSRYY